MANHADHYDHSRLDRELAAAFRTFGLDLDVADPKAAGGRLAGRTATPEIAAAIDEWCRVRRTRLKRTNWRRLAEVARLPIRTPGATPCAISLTARRPMPCRRRGAGGRRTGPREAAGRQLGALVQDACGCGRRSHRRRRPARRQRRFPRDFWVCVTQGAVYIKGWQQPDPAEAVRSYAAAVALRPQSSLAHSVWPWRCKARKSPQRQCGGPRGHPAQAGQCARPARQGVCAGPKREAG